MAEGRGGYRKPTNPAMVSGPGAHSQRTDGQPKMDLPNAQYGENADFQAAQSAGPLARQAEAGTPVPPSFIGLGEPTQDPGTPVTDGAAYGPGAGMEAISGPLPDTQDAQALKKYLPTLIDIAERDDTLPGFKMFVRTIIANS
jgi:hypothetical protein